jgi:drug/metabolite transporter (DMT)-like permease
LSPRKKERRPPSVADKPAGRKGLLRSFSWAFAALLAAAVLWAVAELSSPDENARGAAVHVTQRYLERGPAETGLSHPSAAVFFDYRSYDLWTLGFLFFLAALLGLLPRFSEGHPPYLSWTARASLSFAFLGLLPGLGLGAFCLHAGSNFLDYEPLTAFCRPECARETGDWILGGAAGCAFLGLLLAFWDNRNSWNGGKHGH